MPLIYLTPLFLYFPRFLPSVETQAILVTVVAMYGLLLGRNRRSAPAFGVIALVLMLWIMIKVGVDGSFSGGLGLIQLLIGPLALFGALGLRAPPPSRKVMARVTVYFMLCAALEIIFPSIYSAIASSILSRVSVADGHRGVSLLTPEPTYAAISAVYFLVLAWWSGKHWGFRFRWIEPALALCLLATGSTYTFLLMLALVSVRWPRKTILGTAVAIVVVPLIGVSAMGNDESIRAVVAVSRVLATDFGDFLPSISALDSSLGSRLAVNAASFLTLLNAPLGLGLNCEAIPKAFDAASFDFAFNNAVLVAVMADGCVKPQSYAATIALGLGALSLAFSLLLVVLIKHARGTVRRPLWMPPLALALVMLVVQGQLTNPIPWLLIFFSLTNCLAHPQTRHCPLPISDRLPSPT